RDFRRVEKCCDVADDRATRYFSKCQGRSLSFGHAPGGSSLAGALFAVFAGKLYCWRRTDTMPKQGRTLVRSGRSHNGPDPILTGNDRSHNPALCRLSYGATKTTGRCGQAARGLFWSRLSEGLLTVPLRGVRGNPCPRW